jgi:hypothetical protein
MLLELSHSTHDIGRKWMSSTLLLRRTYISKNPRERAGPEDINKQDEMLEDWSTKDMKFLLISYSMDHDF